MNAGLIVGFVTEKNGDRVDGAEVIMPEIRGMAGGKIAVTGEKNTDFGSPRTETDSDGYFELIFGWSGTDIASPIGGAGRARITIVAAKEIWHDSRSNTTYLSPRQTIVGYMLKDVLGQAGLTTSPFKGMPELLNFTKDLIDSYRKMKSHPLFNVGMLTPESWIILSAATLVINK